MNYFESIYYQKGKDGVELAEKTSDSITDLSYEDIYWVAKILYVYTSGKDDDYKVISLLDKAFEHGLNFHSCAELYIDAAQIMSRLYIKYTRYEEAINYLNDLDDLSEKTLDWVHVYFAYAQVMSDNITRIARNPDLFFKRLDKISVKSISRRNEVFLSYLQRIDELVADGTITDYAKDLIEAKTAEYNLTEKWEERNKIYQDEEETDDTCVDECVTSEFEIKTVEVKVVDETRVKELESEINDLKSTLNTKDDEINDYKNKISELINKNENLESQIALLKQKLSDISADNEKIKKESTEKEKALSDLRISCSESVGIADNIETADSDGEINGHQLLNRCQHGQKILVIGALAREKDLTHLRKVAERLRFDSNRDFDFYIDYDKNTNITRQLNFEKYTAIIAGPMPHSAAGKGDSSSLIEELKKNGNVKVYEAKNNSGKLELTKSSFERVLNYIFSDLKTLTID